MRQVSRFTLICFALMLFFTTVLTASASPDEDDNLDYSNSRVARITVVRGDVQIRRADNREWEEATANLPLVEGDRLATGQDSLVEIQFDRDNYLRLAADSILKIVTLNDNGVSVSLPEGILSVRLGSFKNKRDSFEIDAPNITLAAERAGLYRLDATNGSRSSELKITVSGGGQARVYSETSGYTIRNGRTARVFLSGEFAGDVDFNGETSRDYFDDWIAVREEKLARSRRDDYRSYYDSEIYGADELNDYGEWIETARYGKVWRPYRNSIASYNNWTPYRYGHWRYLTNYGWTWIADEPWGWATSHYGRWVSVDSGWAWCPSERGVRRSHWQAALVVFTNVGQNICWYPLPYNYSYSHHRRSRTIVYNTTIINNPPVTPPTPPQILNDVPIRVINTMPGQIPRIIGEYAGAVSQMPLASFGKVRGGIVPASELNARQTIDSLKNNGETKIDLPDYKENLDTKIAQEREIVTRRLTLKDAERELDANNTKIGAMSRVKGAILDEKLREERIFKGRTPVVVARPDSTNVGDDQPRQPRTGVFERQPRAKEQNDSGEVFERPTPRQPKAEIKDDNQNDDNQNNDHPRGKIERVEGKIDRAQEERPVERPRKEDRDDDDQDNNRRQPVNESPRQPERRKEPRREEPRREEPRREEPRQEEPRREEPRREEPPRREVPNYEPPKQRDEPMRQQREEPRRETPQVKSEKIEIEKDGDNQ